VTMKSVVAFDHALISNRVRLSPNQTGEGDILRGNKGIRGRSDHIPAEKVVRMKSSERMVRCMRCGGSAGKLRFVGFTRHWMWLLVGTVVVGTKETTRPKAAHECRFIPIFPNIHLHVA